MEQENEMKEPFGEELLEEMRKHRMVLPSERVCIRMEGAGKILRAAMRYFIGREGRQAVWLEEYDRVAAWLSDSKGEGLLLCGNCGNGKSILSRLVIPAILLKYKRLVTNVYDAGEMNRRMDEALSRRVVSIDDIGTESESVEYGNRRMVFAEIVDRAEKQGNLLIVSTNLRERALIERYGDRVMDRLVSIMRIVEFNGESMRK
jgi:DNA replication protein DnaC